MNARALSLTHYLALAMIALAAGAMLLASLIGTRLSVEEAEDINMSGRQRMLSQRIALFALESATAESEAERATALENMRAATALFEDSHAILMDHAIDDEITRSIYRDEPSAVGRRSLQYAGAARRFLFEEEYTLEAAQDLARQAAEVLPHLDAATGQFEAEAARHLDRSRRMQLIGFAVLLGILLLTGAFVFRPAARAVNAAMAAQRASRKEAEAARDAAERANRAKSEFLATMSHEIRSPLNGVIAMTTLMKTTPLSEEQTSMLSTISQSGDLLLSVINDILELSKIEAGALSLEEIDFSLEEVGNWAQSVFAPQCAAKGVSFRLSMDLQAEPGRKGDPNRIRQIVSNLISNAVKFTEHGEIALEMETAGEGETRLSVIRIIDSGTGIARDRLEAIFEPFQQAESGVTRTHGGTGLGLTICRRLARHMGGDVTVSSELGHGSVFEIRLPLQHSEIKVQSQAAAADQPADLRDLFSDRKPRILAVDDIATNRMIVEKLLDKVGADAETAQSGAEAIEKFASSDYDLILMDVHMPEMDGRETTRRIRAFEQDRARRPIPVIALTADVISENIESYRECGMTGFVSKPIQLDALVAEIRRTIADKTDEQARVA